MQIFAVLGMASLDDKVLDGPSVGYCSSSDEAESDAPKIVEKNEQGHSMPNEGGSRTGPKGVLADYERFQQNKAMAKEALEEHLLEVANRFSLAHKPKSEDEDEDEEELLRIRQRRLEQLKNFAKGRILEVPDRMEFLSLIENESSEGTLLFMHIYSDGREQSERLNDALLELAGRLNQQNRSQPTTAKFYKVQTKVLGTSDKFARDALPALQVYQNEQLIGNFIRLTAELGDDYDGAELYTFLKRNGIPLELDKDDKEL